MADRDESITKSDEARFWPKVDRRGPDDCWIWTAGKRNGQSYGSFWLAGRTERAHRVSYRIRYGPIRDPQIRHTCDTPGCVNPGHLLPGVNQDNVDDREHRGRGRWRRGEKMPNASMTDATARAILLEHRRLAAGGRAGVYGKLPGIAERHGVSLVAVKNLIKGATYRHLR